MLTVKYIPCIRKQKQLLGFYTSFIHFISIRYATKGEILNALDALLTRYQGGTTATNEAMEMVLDETKYFLNGPGVRPDATNVVLVITDGVPFPDSRKQPALDAAKQIQEAGIIMFAVGITNLIEEDVLKALSSNPQRLDQNYFTSIGFDVLEEITGRVAIQTCRGGEATPPPGIWKLYVVAFRFSLVFNLMVDH